MRPQSTTSRQQFVFLCGCGCGQPTLIARKTNTARGWVQQQPQPFLHGHNRDNRAGKGRPQPQGTASHLWRGGRYVTAKGYIKVYRPQHPQAQANGYVSEHRLVAEEMLGRPLGRDEIVHHRDGNPANNTPENLVVMTQAEHVRLHARQQL